MKTFVFDTSAWFALIEDEPGSDMVQDILEKTRSAEDQILVSFMSFMEIFYITLQEREISEAKTRLQLIESLPIIRVESTPSINMAAAKLKAEYHISVADAWIAALAKERNATLVHKDPEFDQIKSELQVLELPYKK